MAAETATRAAEKYGVAPLDVDAVVREAAAAAGELGNLVRAELGLPALEAEAQETSGAEAATPEAADENEAVDPPDALSVDAEAPAEAPAEDDFPEELESDAPEEGTLAIATLTRVLSAAITTREEYSGGFVICGVAWETASPATLVKALRRALGMRKAAPAPALPPEDADPDEWEAPAEEEGAFALHAAKRLTVISLAIEDDAAGAREKEAKAKAQSDGAEKELGTPQSETDAEAIETPEPRETDETDETEYVYERAEDAAAHRALLETLLPLLGSSTASNQHARTATVDAGAFPADADALLDAAVAAGAPEPPKPPDWIPPDELVEVVATRAARPDREPVTSFQILTPSVQPRRPGGAEGEDGEGEDAEGVAPSETPAAQVTDDANEPPEPEGEAGDEAAGDGDGDGDGEMLTQTRWVIPAGGATMVVVRFASPSAGDGPLAPSSASAAIASRRFASSGGASTRASRRTPRRFSRRSGASSRGDSPRRSAERRPGCS